MPMASCATPVVEGMVVQTRTERVERMRYEALKLLLVNHPLDCPVWMRGRMPASKPHLRIWD
jgi:NADH-quinone oxidoreductase subunit G